MISIYIYIYHEDKILLLFECIVGESVAIMNVCVYIYIYIYTHMYTHIHYMCMYVYLH